jgi:hypothetical protein
VESEGRQVNAEYFRSIADAANKPIADTVRRMLQERMLKAAREGQYSVMLSVNYEVLSGAYIVASELRAEGFSAGVQAPSKGLDVKEPWTIIVDWSLRERK